MPLQLRLWGLHQLLLHVCLGGGGEITSITNLFIWPFIGVYRITPFLPGEARGPSLKDALLKSWFAIWWSKGCWGKSWGCKNGKKFVKKWFAGCDCIVSRRIWDLSLLCFSFFQSAKHIRLFFGVVSFEKGFWGIWTTYDPLNASFWQKQSWLDNQNAFDAN